ncbi:uncharacterized protein LOC131238760 isoform X2 [Magnolia sinica]|uniref:uncharacterized protein LOC131238760 isoform X2 n=1 Tax=Magnolia sinica TaxID=86752 RepID=UPI0026586C30|nr:uncharacterized protein LOC131238760 isoform X2 [Magnolia sinica]
MWSSRVPRRMRAAHPSLFTPKTFFFSPLLKEYGNEWAECFGLKAAAVYSAICGRDADELLVAEKFLKCIAFYCLNPVNKAEPEAVSIATQLVDKRPTKLLPIKIKETCDAVYIVVAFLRNFKQWAEEDREKIDGYIIWEHGPHLVSDMAILDNQLLLNQTINVVQNLDQAVIETLRFMLKDTHSPSPSVGYLKVPFNREDFHEVVALFCWYFSPFFAEKKLHGRIAKELNTKSTLLECLHYSLVRPTKDDQVVVTAKLAWPIPTAKKLAQSGVQFEADPDGAIQVQFTKPVFKLPGLVFDTKMETVVSNLIALENSKPKRPLTRYFQLMNELVDDVEDVRVLKRFGVVRGRWKKEDVVDFVKKMGNLASCPSMYPAMDDEICKMKEWHDERMRKALEWTSALAAAIIVVTVIFVVKGRA